MIKRHSIRLNPTPEQIVYFYKAAGTARYAYNFAVEHWHKADDDAKPTAHQLKRRFNATKPDWAYDVTKCAPEGAFMDFGDALKRYQNDQNKAPRFKSSKRGHFSFYIANDKFRVSGHGIRVPKLGWVNMAEKLRFHGKIMSARIKKQGHHWYASIAVELPDKVVPEKKTACGVDVGLLRLATLSDGTLFDNARPLRHHLQRLAKLQRVLAGKQPGSRKYRRVLDKVRALHARVAHIRTDILHKLTTMMAKRFAFVATETLNVKGLTKNHRLALSLQDAALGQLKQLLEAKVLARQGVFVQVDRFFPSSKLCSQPGCAGRRDDLTLSDRVFVCPDCGFRCDRDENAARNILYEGLRIA